MATRQHRELEYAFFALTILSGVYVAYTIITVRQGTAPAGSHPFGHWLGIIGTLLMLMTETLYSIRKRTRLLNRAGPVRRWLSFHIFTGIVGPFLVLMHTGLAFRGLAGATMMLTILIVISGFIGRYLYGAVQRSGQQSNASYEALSRQIAELHEQIAAQEATRPERLAQNRRQWLQTTRAAPRWLLPWHTFRLRRRLASAEAPLRRLQDERSHLLRRKARLEADLNRNDRYQRLFSLWHLIHIPLGITLFVAIAIHVAATIFFRAGLFR